MLKEISLNDNESKVLYEEIKKISNNYTPSNVESYKNTLKCIEKYVPDKVRNNINLINKGLYDAILIKNLPIEKDIPNTPSDSKNIPYLPISDTTILLISGMVGQVFNLDGRIQIYENQVHNLFPIRAIKDAQLGGGSTFLDWHIEDAFHEKAPQYCSLLCIRSDNKTKTLISFLDDLCIPDELEKILKQPRFKIEYDETFKDEYKKLPLITPIILENESKRKYIKIDYPVTYGIDEESQKALYDLKVIINKNKKELSLEEGDLLLFNNLKIIHARTAYIPNYEGEGRWLKRTMIMI